MDVATVARPTRDPDGHARRSERNTVSRQARWIVLRRGRNRPLKATVNDLMFAPSRLGTATSTRMPAPSPARPAPTCADALNLGSNASPAHPPTWNGACSETLVPSADSTPASTCCAAQSLGLNRNPVRLIVNAI